MDKIEQLKEFGINFKGYSEFIPENKIAMDASLLTESNAGVPLAFTTYIDPVVVKILTAPTRSRQIAGERHIGDWTTTYAQFITLEETGFVQAYDDYADNGKSGVNTNYPVRQNFVFETVISYGDRESDIAGKANFDLVSRKQQSAASTLDIAFNTFNFYGVEGLENYGILNSPNLPDALTPANVGTDASITQWKDKTAQQIYNDIKSMVTDMAVRSKGLIDMNSSYKLVLSPEMATYLYEVPSQMLTSVMVLLEKNLPNLKIVTAPQMSTNAGELVQLWADVVNVEGASQKTLEFAYSDKIRAGRVIAELSHFKQKFSAGTYGAIIYQPFAVSQMLGV